MSVQDDASFLEKVAAANDCNEVALFSVTPPTTAELLHYRRGGDQFDTDTMQHAVAGLHLIVTAVLPGNDDAAVEIVGLSPGARAPFYAIVIFSKRDGVPFRAGVFVNQFADAAAADQTLARMQAQMQQFRDALVP